MKQISRFGIALSLVLMTVAFVPLSHAQDVTVTFLASPVMFPESPGHAFLLIALKTNTGSKEDALGFYPASSNAAQVVIGGPGMVKSEFQNNPTRFARVTASFKTAINLDQRRRIYQLADQFNQQMYRFTDGNCIDFVDSVARALGLKVPNRTSTQTPEAYVKKLADLNT
jgi:hypothetical protein